VGFKLILLRIAKNKSKSFEKNKRLQKDGLY